MDKALVARILELGAEPIYFGATEADLGRELTENCWSISADDEERSQVTPAELAAALDEVIERRREQVGSLALAYGAIFYTWFDAQACQLRCCLISNIHSELPFSCNITCISSALPVAEDFLSSQSHIPWSEVTDAPWSDPAEDNTVRAPLKVYAVQLP